MPDLSPWSLVQLVDPASGPRVKDAQHLRQAACNSRIALGMSNKVIMIRKYSPSFKFAGEVMRDGEKTAL
jgi:hypothetical protein